MSNPSPPPSVMRNEPQEAQNNDKFFLFSVGLSVYPNIYYVVEIVLLFQNLKPRVAHKGAVDEYLNFWSSCGICRKARWDGHASHSSRPLLRASLSSRVCQRKCRKSVSNLHVFDTKVRQNLVKFSIM